MKLRSLTSPVMLSDFIAHVAAYRQRDHAFMIVSVMVVAHVQNHVHFMAMYRSACGMTIHRLSSLSVVRHGHVSPCP